MIPYPPPCLYNSCTLPLCNTRPAAHICTNLPKVCSRGGQTISTNNPDKLEMWQGNSFTIKWKVIVLVLAAYLASDFKFPVFVFCLLISSSILRFGKSTAEVCQLTLKYRKEKRQRVFQKPCLWRIPKRVAQT